MRKLSSVVADDNFNWPKIPPDPDKGTQGNYMPLMEAVSRHLGLPPSHLSQEIPQMIDYANVQGQPFNYPSLSNQQVNQYTAHHRLALRVPEVCDFYYAQCGWPKSNVAELLRQAGL